MKYYNKIENKLHSSFEIISLKSYFLSLFDFFSSTYFVHYFQKKEKKRKKKKEKSTHILFPILFNLAQVLWYYR